MLLTTKEIFSKCYGQYAVPAVNVFFMEEIHGLFSAAQEAKAAVIVQTTPFARDYANDTGGSENLSPNCIRYPS